MIRSFTLKTDRVEVVKAFARKEIDGVSISFPSASAPKLAAHDSKRMLAYDSAESIRSLQSALLGA